MGRRRRRLEGRCQDPRPAPSSTLSSSFQISTATQPKPPQTPPKPPLLLASSSSWPASTPAPLGQNPPHSQNSAKTPLGQNPPHSQNSAKTPLGQNPDPTRPAKTHGQHAPSEHTFLGKRLLPDLSTFFSRLRFRTTAIMLSSFFDEHPVARVQSWPVSRSLACFQPSTTWKTSTPTGARSRRPEQACGLRHPFGRGA